MHVQRLKNLLAVGESLLMPPLTYTLGFNDVDCGTYACFVGHYQRKHGKIVESDWWEDELPVIAEHFDISKRQAEHIFGPAPMEDDPAAKPGQDAYDELRLRLAILRDMIQQAEAKPALRIVA